MPNDLNIDKRDPNFTRKIAPKTSRTELAKVREVRIRAK